MAPQEDDRDRDERLKRVKAQTDAPSAPLDPAGYPTMVDDYGKTLPPNYIVQMTGEADMGRPAESSIFSVPGALGPARNVTVQEILDMLYQAGFRGRAVMPGGLGPHPRARKMGERAPRAASYPPTGCQVCSRILTLEERGNGFTLLELRHGGLAGCKVCSALHAGIDHFARLLVGEFDAWETFVKQKSVGDSFLLADTSNISVRLEKEGKPWTSFSLSATEISESDESGGSGAVRGWIPDTSTFAAVSRAKEWLSTCTKHHGDCLVPATTELPSRVLVVSNHNVFLRETKGEIGRYVALSHCWGRNPVVRTLRANIRDHKENIPWPSLSKTFQDAIIFTWRLGFHYLWIDSLCIIQDDPDDWAEQASRMAQVFSNAQLTIAASRAADGAGGCFTRYASEPFTLVETDGQVRAVTDPGAWAAFVPAPATTDRDGASRRLRIGLQIEHGLTRAPLLQRAWVLQEQVLSPRLLHFACGELYWECVSHVACECRGWERRAETLQSETRLRKAHGRLVEPRYRHRRGGGLAATAMAAKAAEPLGRSKDFEAYRTLVEQYMDLDITNDADRLPALSGITFGRPHDEYLAGMWRSMLIESLHWSPSRRGAERRAYRPATYRAPSWSWASIEGHITHVQDFAASSYRSDDNAKPKATVIAVSCTPEGIDVRGRIKGGYLRIRGPTEEATVSKVRAAGANDRAGADTCAELVGKHGHIHGTCLLDVPLVSARAEPAEVKKSDRVLCLQISTSAALVLKSIASPPGSYTRVGILITDKQTTHAWFTHSRSEAVFIS